MQIDLERQAPESSSLNVPIVLTRSWIFDE